MNEHRTGDAIRAAVIQMHMDPDRTVCHERALGLCRDAVAEGARLILLPELFAGPYFCQTEDSSAFDRGEPIPGPTSEVFTAFAAETGAVLVVSVFERRAPGLYHNTALVIDGDAGVLGRYRKMHIPDDPGYYEKFFFTPGDLGFRSFETRAGHLGTLVCWDQWYPEAARLAALKGAEILLYPTAIGWHPEEKAELGETQHDAWHTIQRAHAIANGCFVLSANRWGFEPAPDDSGGIEFWGRSFIAAPDGRVLAVAGSDADEVLIADLDRTAIERQRRGWPFLRDRRIDAYDGLVRRFDD